MSFSVGQSWVGRAVSTREVRTLRREEVGRGSHQEGERSRKEGGEKSMRDG